MAWLIKSRNQSMHAAGERGHFLARVEIKVPEGLDATSFGT